MQTFLQLAATNLLATISVEELPKTLVLLPSRRSVFFMQRAIQQQLGSSTWLPTCMAIEDFVTQLTQLEIIPQTELLLRFYSIYKQYTPTTEQDDFAHFVQWASTILADFNELDAYSVPSGLLFQELTNIKNIERWNPSGEAPTKLQEEYLGLWSKLKTYYSAITQNLIDVEKAYLGLAYRKANENATQLFRQNFAAYQHCWWIGFNALNACEEGIIDQLLTTVQLKLVWDTDAYYLNFRQQEAGLFLRRHLKKWPALHEIIDAEQLVKPKHISVHQATGFDGQSVTTAFLLDQLSLEEREKTAVVMADENALIPIAQNLPSSVDSFNVTASYSLKNSLFADWLLLYVKLHSDSLQRGSLYHKHLLPTLDHPATKAFISSQAELSKAKGRVVNENMVFLKESKAVDVFNTVFNPEILQLLLGKKTTVEEILSDAKSIFNLLFTWFDEEKEKNSFQLEQLLAVKQVVEQILGYATAYELKLHAGTLRLLMDQLLELESVSFIGEPLVGLQIMGMLESRTLDFERVILTSVNEDVLPAGKSGRSFIPYDVKRAYGLPTHHEKDAIYAYHFYRLIQRCKEVHLVYDNAVEGLGSQEESRFIKQLEIEWANEERGRKFIRETGLSFPKGKEAKEVVVPKDEVLIDLIKSYLKQGISPSALVRYIGSPIDFYFRHLLRLKDVEEVSEALEDRQAGNIIHELLEERLKPYVGKLIPKEAYKALQKELQPEIEKRLKSELNIQYVSGKNHLILTYLVAFVERFIQFEINRLNNNPIHLVGVEVGSSASRQSFSRTLEVDGEEYVLKGIADRIEREGNTVRIIDYKTGSVEQTELRVRSMEDVTTRYDRSKAMQLLVYAWIYWPHLTDGQLLESCIFSFPKSKSGLLKLQLPSVEGASGGEEISAIHLELFEEQLREVIREMVDPAIDFMNKEDAKYTLFNLQSPS